MTVTYINKEKAMVKYEKRLRRMKQCLLIAAGVTLSVFFIRYDIYIICSLAYVFFHLLYTWSFYAETKKRLEECKECPESVVTEDVRVKYIMQTRSSDIPAISIDGIVWQYKKVKDAKDIVVDLFTETAAIPADIKLAVE